MSITTLSLIESLLQQDRPAAWWGLDTADPTVDDSGNGYTLTAVATPANSASLHTRGDTGASGSRDFNGSTQGYTTPDLVTTLPDGPPPFHASNSTSATSATALTVSPGGIMVGDLILFVSLHATAAATVTTGPTGYTQVGSTLNAGNHAVAVYKKTAVTADTVPQEVSLVWNSSANNIAAMLIYRGLNTTVSGLIFDSGQQGTSSDTSHSTTSETYPDGSRQVVLWSKDASTVMTPFPTGKNERVNITSGTLQLQAVDYERELAGTGTRSAVTDAATTLGAIIITFGSPLKTLEDSLHAITQTMTIGCLVNLDTVAAGTRTIVRKHQSWGVNISTATLQFVYRDGGGTDRTISGPTLSTATTYRLWVVDDGTNINFYVNGTKTSTARTGTAGYTQNSNAVTIAHYNDGATKEFLDSRIDELAIYAAPFSQTMVMIHNTAATSGTFGQQRMADQSGRYPRWMIELAVDSQPTARCHTFSDVSGLVRTDAGIQTTRGRNYELDRMTAGTMSLVLNNRDGAYDALKPTRVIRFRAQTVTDGVVYPIFFGYTEAPQHNRPHYGLDKTVALQATDIFKALSLDKIRDTLVRPSEFAGARINAALADVVGLQVSVEEGVHEIIGDDLQGTNRLEHCQAVAETDGGPFFGDARGRAIFQDNQHRSRYERTVRATFGGANTTAGFPCKDLQPDVDETRLFTAAAVTPSSGTVQRVVNDAAALEYFERTKEVATLHSLDGDALAMAQHIVNAYAAPLVRIKSLPLQPAAFGASSTMWTAVLALEISHRIKTIEKPIGASVEIAREHFVEGMSHAITASDWTVSLSLSPIELEGKYFIIGTSKIGDANALIGW